MNQHVPRKRFGQNFLIDRQVIAAIVDAVAPERDDCVVEIGPGLGALTDPLLKLLDHLQVVEIDRDIIARLKTRYPPGKLTLHEGDALAFDFASLCKGSSAGLRIVGNLPYNISTPILFHLLQYVDVVEDQHFMLQKEVIDRMVARPATSAYGRLSVMLQWRYAMQDVLFVPPHSFDPPPRVDSAVVRMQPFSVAPTVDARLLSELVQVAFSQRRKLLRHTLGRWLEARGFAGSFDVQRRAVAVPVSEYLDLAQATGEKKA